MRDEQPLYYNDHYDSFALSRFEDVQRGLIDWQTYRSGRSDILELIKADIEYPSCSRRSSRTIPAPSAASPVKRSSRTSRSSPVPAP